MDVGGWSIDVGIGVGVGSVLHYLIIFADAFFAFRFSLFAFRLSLLMVAFWHRNESHSPMKKRKASCTGHILHWQKVLYYESAPHAKSNKRPLRDNDVENH